MNTGSFTGNAFFVAQLDELHRTHTCKVLPDIDRNLGNYHERIGAGMVEFLTRAFPKTGAP